MRKRQLKYILLLCITAAAGGCLYMLFFYTPAFDWEKSAEKEIIYTTVTRQHTDLNYIPDLRIWGNGDAVWVIIAPDGRRTVYQGHLSQEQIYSILEDLRDVGFFRLSKLLPKKEAYACSSSAVGDTFLVDLDQNMIYSEFIWTADDRTCALIRALVHGEGFGGNEFIPAVGKLHVLPIEKTDLRLETDVVFEWPDAGFGYDLETVYREGNDRVVEGEELALAWDIVNRNHNTQPVVLSGGKRYWIAVLIRGITEAWVE